AGWGEDFHRTQTRGDLDLDLFTVELAFAQLLAEYLSSIAVFAFANAGEQRVEYLIFRSVRGLAGHFFVFLFAQQFHRHEHEVANDGVDVSAHIAHFGELGGLYLDERRAGQLGETTCGFGFTNARWSDHENVLGRDFVAQRFRQLHAAP